MNGNPQYDMHRKDDKESGYTRMGDPALGGLNHIGSLPHETNGDSVLFSLLKQAANKIDHLSKENQSLKEKIEKYKSKEHVRVGW
jgi:hypothetical protein